MTLKAPTTESRRACLPRSATRETIVIADSGDTAAVIVLHTDRMLGVGSTFLHNGSMWQITGRRPHSRALIASPVSA